MTNYEQNLKTVSHMTQAYIEGYQENNTTQKYRGCKCGSN